MFSFSKREKIMIAIIGLLIVLNIIQYFKYSVTDRNDSYQLLLDTQTEQVQQQEKESSQIDQNTQEQNYYVVYVCGNVRKPGVYELPSSSRVNDAVEKAGGLLPNSDLNAINLAEKIQDGQKIYIPKIGEIQNQTILSSQTTQNTPNFPGQSGKININTASKEELKTLDRIGDKLAERIIEYRQTHGPFKSIEEIKNVNGIGDKIFEAIKDSITVQ
ncbi:helix-hairpin-helix domain-containing protein [Caldicellulosiruptor naganoensis]|uniref:Helix-hairpin-helix domain-containing protein n=1 Tax=Caldicellulosiruptor naganoensis TaxID=29324 RepID=A0ABY7BE62_9FIRM|nr:helix-hairpin-helix domain-containing protein [Caldicellulosiruptor naganoensis]WAM30703.1 helix-hairpin-helix domain-containing protein [Caldicellulosiruptor naganoensis]